MFACINDKNKMCFVCTTLKFKCLGLHRSFTFPSILETEPHWPGLDSSTSVQIPVTFTPWEGTEKRKKKRPVVAVAVVAMHSGQDEHPDTLQGLAGSGGVQQICGRGG